LIESFKEADKNIQIQGAAKSNDDVAEFLRRLSLSVFFKDVHPVSTVQSSTTSAEGGGVKFVKFDLVAAANF
jgi:Tfp pilus assembly protein PilN